MKKEIYNKTIDEVYKNLKSSENGLSSEEANKRLKKDGKNELTERKKKSNIGLIIQVLTSKVMVFLNLVVLFSVVISYIRDESYIDCIIIAIIYVINSVLGYYEIKNVDKAIDKINEMFDCKFNVIRDKKDVLIDAKEIVPGDVIYIASGDYIPCDARIISAENLEINEAALTDNYKTVKKGSNILNEYKEITEQSNMVFAGSNVINGEAKIIATATGMNTILGKIANNLLSGKENVSPLQNKINQLSNIVIYIVLFLIIDMIIIGIINRNDLFDILMLSILLTVAAIPEGLSSIINIILSICMNNMVRKNILFKNKVALETLGSANVICAGKTNNLTMNNMMVKSIYVDCNIYRVDFEKIDNVIFNNCLYFCSDVTRNKNGYHGNDADIAINKYLENIGYKNNDDYKIISKDLFDYNKKVTKVSVSLGNKEYSFIKGDFEEVFNKCSKYVIRDNVYELDNKIRENIFNIYKYMCWESLEVIALAYEYDDSLVFIGLVGILDPIDDEVKAAIMQCKAANIRPILITGNSFNTALSIAKEAKIVESSEEVIDGKSIMNANDDELYYIVDKYRAYARITPELKTRLIEVMQAKGMVVAMAGDGINDALAIKRADVGIGFGVNGSDIVKEVADCILTDNSFLSIINGIKEGRRVTNNIRKVIMYLITTNIIEVLLIFIAMVFNVEMFSAIQIYWINLVTGTIPAIMLGFEKDDEKERKTVNSKSYFTPLLKVKLITNIIFKTLVCILLYFYFLGKTDLNTANTLLFILLLIHEFLFAFSCKDLKNSVLNKSILSNPYLNISILCLGLFQIFILFSSIGDYFVVRNINYFYIILVFVVCIMLFIIDEITKKWFTKHFKDYFEGGKNEK